MSGYEEDVDISEAPESDLRKVIAALMDHLHLRLTKETTPDYEHYEVRPRP